MISYLVIKHDLSGSECQLWEGKCPFCEYEFIDFTNPNRQRKDFEYCLGFDATMLIKRNKTIIVFECPKCFKKSWFHVDNHWVEDYSEWIKHCINKRNKGTFNENIL